LGCGHIRERDGYFTCSNPDGNNPQAVTVYNNDSLNTVNYTRSITKTKRATDIFDLVSFYKDCSFPESLKYVHEILGLDYYSDNVGNSVLRQTINTIKELNNMDNDEDDHTPLQPIPQEILHYYLPYGNKMWLDEGISLITQAEFNIAYDDQNNYIAIPVFDELGSLIGVKGRYFGIPDEQHLRFVYLEKCNKSRVLYGYWQNREHIKNSRHIIVVESEKSVLKLAEYGYRNVVATMGKTISKYQVELISRTGCIPIFAFDKDVEKEELNKIADMFIKNMNVYAVIDTGNLLEEKESPMDREEIWNKLYKDYVFQLK